MNDLAMMVYNSNALADTQHFWDDLHQNRNASYKSK